MNKTIKMNSIFILVTLSNLMILDCKNQPNLKEDKDLFSEPIRYLALGDSYTIGESVAENDRWPIQLADSLRLRGLNVSEPYIIAKTGWTTDELQEGIDLANPKGPYDLVSLLIGVNNQYRGRTSQEYRIQFLQLLEQAILFANGKTKRVIVLSIPDWGVTPFAANRNQNQIATEIDQFNSINKEEANLKNVHYVDVTPFSREARSDLSLIASDGLHPSGKMYSGWVKLALPKVFVALEDSH